MYTSQIISWSYMLHECRASLDVPVPGKVDVELTVRDRSQESTQVVKDPFYSFFVNGSKGGVWFPFTH